jgi:hypothetical protein
MNATHKGSDIDALPFPSPGVETAHHDDLLKRRAELFFQKDAVRGVIQKGGHESLRWSISKPTPVVNGLCVTAAGSL